MAANHRIRAILRLRHQGTISKRQADLLLALETFISPAGTWGEAGTELIETETGIDPKTIARARGEMVDAGWLDYERGNGRGIPAGTGSGCRTSRRKVVRTRPLKVVRTRPLTATI